MAATSPFPKLLDLVEKFVIRHEGQWTHQDWEELVDEGRALGYSLDEDEGRRNLGNMLEGARFFYVHGAAPTQSSAARKAPAKKSAARKKA